MKFRLTAWLIFSVLFANAQTASEIIKKAEEKLQGATSYSEMTIEIVRPRWKREMKMKSWSKGTDLGIVMITAPTQDKGNAFLKKGKQIWNWVPKLERTIKMPPSMMSQNWMGTDMTNDDLIQESSIQKDYDHKILEDEEYLGRTCWVIELVPKAEAAVAWGRLLLHIDKQDYMQLKTQFFDEDGELVNTMQALEIKELGGKMLPSRFEIIPADKPRQKTIMWYEKMEFDIEIEDSFFTIQNLKRLK